MDLTYCEIDGVRLNIPEGWWLLRASNTQAALIARCESDTDEGLQIVIKNLNKLLKDFKLGI
jgi:phosphomannomutase